MREIAPQTRHPVQLYEQGPFPAAPVCEPPDLLVELFERFTGQRFNRRTWEEYERVRAFLDFRGVLLTPDLAARQIMPLVAGTAPVQPRAEDRPPAVTSATRAHQRQGIDPRDLGD